MPYRASKNCSELLDMTQTCPTKMLKIGRHDLSWPEKTAKNCSKVVKIAQNCSNLLKTAQNCPKCLKMFQNVSKCFTMGQQGSQGVMFLHIITGAKSCHYLALKLPVSIVAWA